MAAFSSLARVRFLAMGTTVEVHALAQDLAAAAREVRLLFRAWETALTRFDAQSELSALNRAAGQPFPSSQLLFDVVETALHYAELTDGTFDPTLLHQIERLGYRRTFSEIERAGGAEAAGGPIEPGGHWRLVALDRTRRSITLPDEAGIDLGGIAKGMAVDAALLRLRERGVQTAMVNAGGDLAVLGLPPRSDAWPVGVLEVPGEVVPLQRGALATSGVAKRHWRQGEAHRHHLLDPSTGYPADTALQSATVVAATCAEADVAAKTAFLRGAAAGADFLVEHRLAGLLVPVDGPVQRVGSWPKPSEVS